MFRVYVSYFMLSAMHAAITTIVFGMTLLPLSDAFYNQQGILGALFFLRGRSASPDPHNVVQVQAVVGPKTRAVDIDIFVCEYLRTFDEIKIFAWI